MVAGSAGRSTDFEAGVVIRPAEVADVPAMVDLLRDDMGWPPGEAASQFFAWKHWEAHFGVSPAWVADRDGRLVGLRTFMRWRFESADGVLQAARAVDTVTRAEMRGKGLFRRLTTRAVEELAAQGIALIFNTPNDSSRPGYLRMGWVEVGRPPTWVRLRRPGAVVRMVRSRVPAELFSLPSTAGDSALDVLADTAGVEALLASQPPTTRLRTCRSPGYLRWRYGFAPLQFRACTFAGGLAGGLALYRLRRRGRCVEAAIDEVLVPGGESRRASALAARAVREAKADYGIMLGGSRRTDRPGVGWFGLPGGGPVLTCRPLAQVPGASMDDWDLSLGDVEMF